VAVAFEGVTEFAVGDYVCIRPKINPFFGRGGVKDKDVGIIRSTKVHSSIDSMVGGAMVYTVEFAECMVWSGIASDLIPAGDYPEYVSLYANKGPIEPLKGDPMKFTPEQITKARAKLAKNIKDANAAFRTKNPTYVDITVDMDEVRLIAAIDAKFTKDEDRDLEYAKIRMDFVTQERSTDTIDLLTVKTEKNIGEEDKFTVPAYVGAKRYRRDGSVWNSGYQTPFDTTSPVNKFIKADGSDFQMLRSIGLFQLMSDAEIDALVAGVDLNLDLYFQLFM
jgi:hypothetical protein